MGSNIMIGSMITLKINEKEYLTNLNRYAVQKSHSKSATMNAQTKTNNGVGWKFNDQTQYHGVPHKKQRCITHHSSVAYTGGGSNLIIHWL